ncbi:MAG: GGDEF domain-containing protein [Halochromatium sp.]|nr:GGDEF domain-containing protein [Halochromatium sp.]
MRTKAGRHLPLLCLLAGVLLGPIPELAAMDLTEGWEYRWGDSPFTADGIPTWTLDQEAEDWSAIGFPSNPPSRDGQTNVWFRTILPEGDWRDPVLYLFSVDLIVEIYLDGRKIYQYGDFDEAGQGRFEGWPWHMVSLPQDSGGELIYFRIYSDYMDIGLWGEVQVLERIDLLRNLVTGSIGRLVSSSLTLLIGLLSLLFALVQREQAVFGALALFALASGSTVLSGAQATLLLFDAPLFWDYLGAAGYFLLPVAMALLLQQWLRPAYGWLLGLIWRLNLAYLVGAISLSLLGFVSLAETYPVFDRLFLLSLLVLLLPALHSLSRGHRDQQLILGAYALMSLLLLLDMAVAHNLVSWGRVPLGWGSLGFALSVVAISMTHYTRMQHELLLLNTSLERQVQARTAELEQLASQDALTGLKNRRFLDEVLPRELALAQRQQSPLSLLVCDIDHFKRFNDCYGHAAGDAVLQRVAAHLQAVFRQTDLVCRYGGEEFVIVMPGAEMSDACRCAEAFRTAVTADRIQYEHQILEPVTLSVGIASWPEPVGESAQLLECADRALYRAKTNGRDRVECAD